MTNKEGEILYVGDVFKEKIQEKKIKIEENKLNKIEEISLWLAQAREASFYFEKVFDKKDAEKAYKDAKFLLETIKFLKKIWYN